MPVSSDKIPRRRKNDVLLEGYYLNTVTESTPAPVTTEDSFPVFGFENAIKDVQVTGSTITLTFLEKDNDNTFLDVVTGQRPEATGTRKYYQKDIKEVALWFNRKNKDNTRYIHALFADNWNPTPAYPSGAPADKTTRAFTGNCDIIREFHEADAGSGCYIRTFKIASGNNITIPAGHGIITDPDNNLNALKILLITGTGGEVTDSEEITITSAMITNLGAVDWAEIDSVKTLTTVNSGLFYLVMSGTGVYPASNVTPDGLYS